LPKGYWRNDCPVSQVPVARAYYPSYPGGRDQEDHSSKPAPGKFVRPYLKKPITKKRVGRVSQIVRAPA
jgi:hypothetical protein